MTGHVSGALFHEPPAPRRRSSRKRGRWIACEDCRQFMQRQKDSLYSLVLTDPPYFIDGMDDEWDRNHLRARVKKGVVGSLPVGMKFQPEQGMKLYRFLRPVAAQWRRLLKPGGFALCFSQARLVHRTACAIEDAGFEIRDILAWKYEGQAKAFTQEHFVRKRGDLNDGQKAYFIRELGGRKTPQLKPQMEMIVLAQAPKDGTYVDNWMKHRTGLIDVSHPFLEPGRFPGNVIPVPKPRERHGHITAKQVELLRHLVRIICADERHGEKPVVFDPFAGSGSTGVAAMLEGRAFCGCEIDAEMGEIADRRIADAAK